MQWIVKYSKDIAVDISQLQARHIYIQRVTGAEVSSWDFLQINGQIFKEFLCCTSADDLKGVFITAHIGDVHKLCTLREIYMGEFVIANTCIWEKMSDKTLLYSLMKFNRNIKLWFSKQELSLDGDRVFRRSTTINPIGQFGFSTSVSERKLFSNREKGFMSAIHKSFVRVSPIIFLGD